MFKKREFEGRWWWSDKPEEIRYGILRYDPEDISILETKDPRSYSFHEVVEHDEPRFQKGTMLGRDSNDHPITLLDCISYGPQSSMGLKTAIYHAHTVILGREFNNWDEVQFDGIKLDFTNLLAWLNLDSSLTKREDGVDYIGFKFPDDLIFPLHDAAEIRITATTGSRTDWTHEKTMCFTESRFFRINWPRPMSMASINEWVVQIQRFLSLMIGTPTYPRWMMGLRKDEIVMGEGENAVYRDIEVLGENHGISRAKLNKRTWEMLCSFSNIRDRMGHVIKSWFDYDKKIGPVLDLYFALIFNKHLYGSHQLLFLAQALERYHAVQMGGQREPRESFDKRLSLVSDLIGKEQFDFFKDKLNWANEKTLLHRLNELLEKRGALVKDVVADFPDFPQLVKDSRNYYTHFDPKLLAKGRVAEKTQLALLIQSMKILLEVLFLSDLGIGDAAISKAKSRRASVIHSIGGR